MALKFKDLRESELSVCCTQLRQLKDYWESQGIDSIEIELLLLDLNDQIETKDGRLIVSQVQNIVAFFNKQVILNSIEILFNTKQVRGL